MQNSLLSCVSNNAFEVFICGRKPNISLNLMCSFSCGFPFLPSLLGSRLSTFQH